MLIKKDFSKFFAVFVCAISAFAVFAIVGLLPKNALAQNESKGYCEISNAEPHKVNFYYGEQRSTEGYTQHEVPLNCTSYTELAWYQVGSYSDKVTIEDDFINFKPQSCACWFLEFDSGCLPEGSTVTIDGLENLNTSECTNMYWMFGSCKAPSLNLSKLDTSKVTNMDRMFYNCTATSLDLSNFKTGKVTTMNKMFENCTSNITGLRSFDTSNVTAMKDMFNAVISPLDLSSFNTSNVVDFSGMFGYYSYENVALPLDLSSFNTANGQDFNSMFSYCSATSINLSSFDFSNAANLDQIFQFVCNDVKWPNKCSVLKPGCTVMMMFGSCKCPNITTNFIDTKNITDMKLMFVGACATTIDVQNLNTVNVANMNAMFQSCKTSSLDIRNFNVQNVVNMISMFSNFGLDNANIMFPQGFKTNEKCAVYSMFSYCNCKVLDLQSFDFAKMYDFEGMFEQSLNLTTILVPLGTDLRSNDELNGQNASNDTIKLFSGCTNLIGGAGTCYDSNHVDLSYAHVDSAQNPGYFTAVDVPPAPEPINDDSATTVQTTTSTGDSNFGFVLIAIFVALSSCVVAIYSRRQTSVNGC